MSIFVICNPKGGTGKSTITCLFIEYLNYLSKKVKLIDLDPNQNSQWWFEQCRLEGRQLSFPSNYDYQVVDTAGAFGSAMTYFSSADSILIPFQAQAFDLKVVSDLIIKIENFNRSWLKKLLFIVNRWQNTKDQREIVIQLQDFITEKEAGKIIPIYLHNRPATYAGFLEGRSNNYFQGKTFNFEAFKLFERIILENEKGYS